MLYKYKSNLKNPSRRLRHEMTDAEKLLWRKIRGRQLGGYQFNRQKPIDNFIVDFYCCLAKLVIEIDGGQHYEEGNKEKDKLRDAELRKLGIKVLRFINIDVLKNIEGVILKIQEELNPSPASLFKGRRKISSHNIYDFRHCKIPQQNSNPQD